MDGAAAGARVGRDGAGVERRILDGVAHRAHRRLAVLLDLEERAAAHQPERAALVALEVVVHVHVLMREPDIELEALEDRAHAGAGETHAGLHPAGVDRAGAHPLLDRDRLACLRADLEVHVREGARD